MRGRINQSGPVALGEEAWRARQKSVPSIRLVSEDGSDSGGSSVLVNFVVRPAAQE